MLLRAQTHASRLSSHGTRTIIIARPTGADLRCRVMASDWMTASATHLHKHSANAHLLPLPLPPKPRPAQWLPSRIRPTFSSLRSLRLLHLQACCLRPRSSAAALGRRQCAPMQPPHRRLRHLRHLLPCSRRAAPLSSALLRRRRRARRLVCPLPLTGFGNGPWRPVTTLSHRRYRRSYCSRRDRTLSAYPALPPYSMHPSSVDC